MRHIAIVGAGAIGTLIAAKLIRQGHRVTVVGREHHLPTLRERGLHVDAPDGSWHVMPHAVVAGVTEALSTQPVDLLIVTVKAYDTAAIAESLVAVAHPPHVLTLQNGVGNEETLADAIGPERVLAGALTTPVEVLATGHVRVARPSYRIGLAPVHNTPQAEALLHEVGQALAAEGFRVQYVDDYRSLKWTKLLMNITANAQAALLGWPPARVFAHPVAGALEVRAWREALAVMRALGIRPIPFGGYPLPLVTPLVERLPLAIVRPLMGRFASGGRGDKMPSIYLDLERGRGKTEVPWLNGAVARYGRQVRVPTPVNIALDKLVAAVVTGRLPWSETRDRPERILAAVREEEAHHASAQED